MTRFGRHLGIAFQIADDVLDFTGEERATGKSLGTDLAKQKPTLPLLRLLSQVSGREKAEVLASLARSGNHHREALRPWLDRFGAFSYARAKAIYYTQRAADELQMLPPTPVRDMLTRLTDFVVTREQ